MSAAPARAGVIACGALAVHVRAIARRRAWAIDVHPLDAVMRLVLLASPPVAL